MYFSNTCFLFSGDTQDGKGINAYSLTIFDLLRRTRTRKDIFEPVRRTLVQSVSSDTRSDKASDRSQLQRAVSPVPSANDTPSPCHFVTLYQYCSHPVSSWISPRPYSQRVNSLFSGLIHPL